MQTTKQTLLHRTWTRESYFISTDPSLISISDLNAAFATDLIYWAEPLPEDVMRETLDNSLCFGLYDIQHDAKKTNSSAKPSDPYPEERKTLIGFARCVTDFSTFSYLTDVYILPSYQGKGLGKWIVRCVGEVHDSMPYLRRSMLFTSDWERSVPLYKGVLGMDLVKGNGGKDGGGPAIMQKLGPGFPMTLR
ncbi:uncharacterized protein EKO05_0006560 [Ascochyta rabiei]|uniref:N-acetyltransferase n=1 Tax=Didymella rabiei TaxID=5454 RepID=A0A162W558_DIDRA|nr:uncharacterized protein EKO05_0006560 [Ascochyta rabiei]KZM18805.1 N-acetyltransferase [Ascochyta rabiei]UPX16142.1 hypothetical protein EKO05_0006560 [Ascochyta rabiei]